MNVISLYGWGKIPLTPFKKGGIRYLVLNEGGIGCLALKEGGSRDTLLARRINGVVVIKQVFPRSSPLRQRGSLFQAMFY